MLTRDGGGGGGGGGVFLLSQVFVVVVVVVVVVVSHISSLCIEVFLLFFLMKDGKIHRQTTLLKGKFISVILPLQRTTFMRKKNWVKYHVLTQKREFLEFLKSLS